MTSSGLGVSCLSHIGITVTDLEAARTFYVDRLGFRELYDEVQPTWTRLGLGLADIVIELFSRHPGAGDELDPFYPQPYGLPKIALTVEDVDAAHTHAVEVGLPVLCPVITTRSSRFFFIADPAGTPVQLQQFLSGKLHLAHLFG